jgi:hypothetical protein
MNCDTTIEGRFVAGPLASLTAEQLDFVETFVLCEGKFTRMEVELGLSYPTIRNRLHEVIRSLGYEPGAEEEPSLSLEKRREVLAKLEEGAISADEAVDLIQGGESDES